MRKSHQNTIVSQKSIKSELIATVDVDRLSANSAGSGDDVKKSTSSENLRSMSQVNYAKERKTQAPYVIKRVQDQTTNESDQSSTKKGKG